MRRCDTCDSTDRKGGDTLANMGISAPIAYWEVLDSGEHRCNRCVESIDEALSEMEEDEDNE